MTNNEDSTGFNLGVVLHETGLKADTLRAWERRYGLPQPQRSQGGHRLYSKRDIETVKWLIARQNSGMSISNAVRLWNDLEADGSDPLAMAEYAPATGVVAPVSGVTGDNIEQFKDAWVRACLDFDEQQSERVLGQAFALYAPEQVCMKVLLSGLTEIGQGWYSGTNSVQQEHFASELAMRRLEALIAATPAPTRGQKILVAAPPGEQHHFILLLLVLMLRRRSLDVIYLGSDVPLQDLDSVLEVTRPHLVVSSAQTLVSAASLLDMGLLLQRRQAALAYGGRIFTLESDLSHKIPGTYLGNDVGQAVGVIEEALAMPTRHFQVLSAPDSYRQALQHFREQLPTLEMALFRILPPEAVRAHSGTAFFFLTKNIEAALALGDLELLGSEIEWVKGLLGVRGMPTAALDQFLQMFIRAAASTLDERCQPVLDWMAELAGVAHSQN